MDGVLAYTTLFAGNFAPKNWAYCWGQLLPISSNTALFSLIGTYYGGNGTSNFQLPDLRGRMVVGVGAAPGLSQYDIGQDGGTEGGSVSIAQMAAHVHMVNFTATAPSGSSANQTDPTNTAYAPDSGGGTDYSSNNANITAPYPGTVTMTATGGNQPYQNMKPYLALNYIICLYGIFPSRN